MSEVRRFIVGISGGSGAILGIRLLETLAETDLEIHLVVSETARKVMAHETGRDVKALDELVASSHRPDDMFAPIASGSYKTGGMVIIPCSMKTLAGIAGGYAQNLLLRAADACLKERRKLILVTRETPLSLIHIDNMQRVTRAGAMVLPPVLTMYTKPESIAEVVDQIVGKVLNVLGIDSEVYRRWS